MPPEIRIDVGALTNCERKDHQEKRQRKNTAEGEDRSEAAFATLDFHYLFQALRLPLANSEA
jgi:hypothetical protein